MTIQYVAGTVAESGSGQVVWKILNNGARRWALATVAIALLPGCRVGPSSAHAESGESSVGVTAEPEAAGKPVDEPVDEPVGEPVNEPVDEPTVDQPGADEPATVDEPGEPLAEEPSERPQLEVLQKASGLEILESYNEERHMHGGDPAVLTRLTMNLSVVDELPHHLTVARVALLRAHCTQKTSWDSTFKLQHQGLKLYDWDGELLAEGRDALEVPASCDLCQVEIEVASREVYQACDRHGLRVEFGVDGRASAVELELRVYRVEPYNP